jgi:GDP/UDP-N,N'-diacetylbacillosamine 2-epimerase (hydrolysing)
MNRTICVVTGTRAEYGLLRLVMKEIRDDPDLTLQTVATGMHLSPEFGLTFREIEDDGFVIDRKVEMLTSSDSKVGVTKSIGLGLIGFADSLNELDPDIVLVLGDRFEIFSCVCAALIARIPVAHLHGGESTEGAFDEAFRHSITKMSHLHFVATEEYQRRVIQLGEDPRRVFLVGGLGVDNILQLELLDQRQLETEIGFKFRDKNLLITFHPETLGEDSPEVQMSELLNVLATQEDTGLIFTHPNADTGGRKLISMVKEFVACNDNAVVHESLGQQRYLSCMSFVDGVVGNSSSGLTEAPSFKVGTINIGNRQRGRLEASSVINCSPESKSIMKALTTLYSAGFQNALSSTRNPYGQGGASTKIIEVVKSIRLKQLIQKSFHDLS